MDDNIVLNYQGNGGVTQWQQNWFEKNILMHLILSGFRSKSDQIVI